MNGPAVSWQQWRGDGKHALGFSCVFGSQTAVIALGRGDAVGSPDDQKKKVNTWLQAFTELRDGPKDKDPREVLVPAMECWLSQRTQRLETLDGLLEFLGPRGEPRSEGLVAAMIDDLEKIAADLRRDSPRLARARRFGVSSRSVLVNDHRPRGPKDDQGPGQHRPVEFLNYRTVITLPPGTGVVELSAREELEVTIRGRTYTLDAGHVERIEPNAMSRIVVNIEARDITVPPLMLRTDFMLGGECFCIFPDVEAHKKLSGLKPGAMHQDRDELGVPSQYTRDDLDHTQKALANMSVMVQHTYNAMGGGTCHDRVCMPSNMTHPHWELDFGSGRPSYRPLEADEVRAINAGSRPYDASVAQGLGSWISHAVSNATKIVVHTVKSTVHAGMDAASVVAHTTLDVAKDIVETTEHVVKDVVHTTVRVGEDLVHGDLRGIGKDLVSGLGSAAGDVLEGGENVGGDLLKGTGRLAVVTIHYADSVVHFAITHTGVIGELIGHLIQKIGVLVKKFVSWLRSQLGWEDIKATQQQLKRIFEDGLAQLPTKVATLKPKVDHFFGSLQTRVDGSLDELSRSLTGDPLANAPVAHEKHSDAIEKIEWLFSKIVEGGALASTPALAIAGGSGSGSGASVASRLVTSELESIVADLETALAHPSRAPEVLIQMVLGLLKRIFQAVLELCRETLDDLLGVVEKLVDELRRIVEIELHIPFVSDLFELLVDEKLTVLNLATLALAIPATLISKAVLGRRPFENPHDIALSKNPTWVQDLRIVSGAAMVVDGVLTSVLDACSPAPPTPHTTFTVTSPNGNVAVTEIWLTERPPKWWDNELNHGWRKGLEVTSIVVGGVSLIVNSVLTRHEHGSNGDSKAIAADSVLVCEAIPLIVDLGCLVRDGTLRRLAGGGTGPIWNCVFHLPLVGAVLASKIVEKSSALSVASDLGALKGFWQLGLTSKNPEARAIVGVVDLVILETGAALYLADIAKERDEADAGIV